MPFSYVQYAGNGSTQVYTVPFPYLQRHHVKLYYGLNLAAGTYGTLLAEGVNYDWLSSTQVQITPAPPSNVVLTIRRETPFSDRLVDWQDGSQLTADDLDTADLQPFYLLQEERDRIDILELDGVPGPSGVAAATAPITYDAATQTVGITPATTTAAGSMSAADKGKLNGIAAGATANATDGQLRDRATHTGSQAISTVTGLQTALDGKVASNDSRLSDARTPTAHTQAASTISDSTTAGRALLTAADAAAQRTSLGLGSLATQSGTFSGTSSGINTGDQTITLTGDVTGSGTGSFTATLASTTVTAGSYTYGSFTVDAKGRITAASSGTTPVTTVNGTAPIVSSGGTTPAISISAATTTAAGSMSAADKSKLDGVAAGATANASDAQLRDRTTHTGSQAIATVSGLQTALDGKAATGAINYYWNYRQFFCAPSSMVTHDVWSGAIEIREVGLVGNTVLTQDYAPAINFHWSAQASAAIKMFTDGSIRITAQNNTGNPVLYQSLHAGRIVGHDDCQIDAGRYLFFGREESFGGTDTGGFDYGYIVWDNDNNTYAIDGSSGENGCLRIGSQNDGTGAVSDNIAIEPTADLYLNPGGGLYKGNAANRAELLHANNYNNYAPTLTGAGAYGTWPITVSGTTFLGESAGKDDITTRTTTGFYQTSTGTTAEGWPVNSNSWQHLIACTHTNPGNYYSMQFAGDFFQQDVYFRNTAGSGTTAWSRLLHSNNYTAALQFTQQGSGAVARTYDSKLKDVLSVKDFGAVGDNAANDTAAFQACANAAVALSEALKRPVSVYVPAGNYRIHSQVLFNFVPQYGWARGIVLYGDGRNSSRLIAVDANTTGLIKFRSTGNTEVWHVRDLSLLSSSSANDGTNNGTALFIESTLTEGDYGFGSHNARSVTVERVHIGPYSEDVVGLNSGSVGRWYRAIEVRNKWFPMFNEVFISGADIVLPSQHSAIYCHFCYSPEFVNVYISGYYQYGIYYNCNSQEDFRVESAFLVGPDYGFYLARSSAYNDALFEPGGSILNCHAACRIENIRMERHRQANIIGNYLYVPMPIAPPNTGIRSCIHLVNCADVIVANNQFLEPGYYTDDSNTTVGVRMSVGAKGIMIHGCHLNHGGIGILVDANTKSVESPALGGGNNVIVTNCTSGGQGWWAPTKVIEDKTGIVQSNYIKTVPSTATGKPGGYTEEANIYSGCTDPGLPAYRKLDYMRRTDYASVSNAKLYEHWVIARKSDGTDASCVHVANWTNNSASNPKLAEATYHTTPSGLTQLNAWEWSNDQDTTPFYLLHQYGSANNQFAMKRVVVGSPDSGGAGYRMLRVVN